MRLHLESFSIPNRPVPCIYDGCCRRVVDDIVYRVCIEGEPWSPTLYIEVYSGSTLEAERIVKHVYNIGLNYGDFLDRVGVTR